MESCIPYANRGGSELFVIFFYYNIHNSEAVKHSQNELRSLVEQSKR